MDKRASNFIKRISHAAEHHLPLSVTDAASQLRGRMEAFLKELEHRHGEVPDFDLYIQKLGSEYKDPGIEAFLYHTSEGPEKMLGKIETVVQIRDYKDGYHDVLVTLADFKRPKGDEIDMRHYTAKKDLPESSRLWALSHGVTVHSMETFTSDVLEFLLTRFLPD